MAVAFNGGVVVGADSRTTTGAYIANRVTDKLTYLHERVYCCRSGSAADTQVRWLFLTSQKRRRGRAARGADAVCVVDQAIADVAMSQLQLYAMSHDERPSVAVAATLLEGLCYSNKCVSSPPPRSKRLLTPRARAGTSSVRESSWRGGTRRTVEACTTSLSVVGCSRDLGLSEVRSRLLRERVDWKLMQRGG